MIRPLLLLVASVAIALLIGLGVSAQDSGQAGTQDGPLPPGPHVDLVYAKCQTCHNLRYVTDSAGLPPFLWEDTVDLMVQLGMQVTDEEKANLIEYFTTYLGPDGPPESATAAPSGGEASAEQPQVDGEALYGTNCAGCHQQNGQGIPGAFPPLAGHAPDLYQAEGGRDYLADLLLYGLQGEITVDGATYNGVMPAWPQLSDTELAAVLNHILTAWENDALLPEDFTPYLAEDLADRRDRGLGARDMLERRPTPGGDR